MRLAFPAIGLIGLFVLFLTFPVWQWLWNEWWGNDYYSHGVLIVPVALYLAWRRLQTLPKSTEPSETGSRRALLFIVVAMVGIIYFSYSQTYYLAAFATVGLLGSLIWWFGGASVAKALLFPVGFLMLMIPLPFIEHATLPLALWTGICSGAVTQWLGINVVITGAAVTLPNAALTIGAQCSGINSIISLTTLTTLLSYLLKGPLWGRFALILSGIALAILGNVFRVANLIWVAYYWGTERAFTYYHDYSGFIYFTFALLLLIPIARVFQCYTLRNELF